MALWLRSHSRTRVTSTDGWYLRFADELFSLIASSRLYADKTLEDVQNAAILLTIYRKTVLQMMVAGDVLAIYVISYMVVMSLFMKFRQIMSLMR